MRGCFFFFDSAPSIQSDNPPAILGTSKASIMFYDTSVSHRSSHVFQHFSCAECPETCFRITHYMAQFAPQLLFPYWGSRASVTQMCHLAHSWPKSWSGHIGSNYLRNVTLSNSLMTQHPLKCPNGRSKRCEGLLLAKQ